MNEENTTDQGKGPDYKVRVGNISVAAWENEGKEFGGVPTTYISCEIQRSYKNKEDEWVNTKSIRRDDIPKAIKALDKVYEHYLVKEIDTTGESQKTIGGEKPRIF